MISLVEPVSRRGTLIISPSLQAVFLRWDSQKSHLDPVLQGQLSIKDTADSRCAISIHNTSPFFQLAKLHRPLFQAVKSYMLFFRLPYPLSKESDTGIQRQRQPKKRG